MATFEIGIVPVIETAPGIGVTPVKFADPDPPGSALIGIVPIQIVLVDEPGVVPVNFVADFVAGVVPVSIGAGGGFGNYLLLEDGDNIELEDGTGFLFLE